MPIFHVLASAELTNSEAPCKGFIMQLLKHTSLQSPEVQPIAMGWNDLYEASYKAASFHAFP